MCFRTSISILALAVCALPAQARVIPALVTPSDGGVAWSAAERAALRTRVDALFASSSAIRGSHVGLYAVDTRDGSLLYSRLPDDEFMPASTLKLLVGSVALARLGTAFRFHTEAFFTQPVADRVEPGFLVVRGGGDPFLNDANLNDLATTVATKVRSMQDGVATDSSYFDDERYPTGWVWDDLPFYYAPVVTATTFEENVVHLTVTAGAAVGDPARVRASVLGPITAIPIEGCGLTVEVLVIPSAKTGRHGSESTIDVRRERGGCIEVIGSVPLGGSDTADAAVPSPEEFLHTVLTRRLQFIGVSAGSLSQVAGPWPDEHRYVVRTSDQRQLVWTHDSEALPNIVADMWYPSDNLVAELLLKALGVARSGVPGTTANGAALEREWLHSIGVDTRTVTLADGSGLSIYDRITPHDLVAILQADWNGPNRRLVLDALPVAGVRGTLREEFVDTPAAGRAFVKTGSMSHVRGLAGYVESRRHGAVTFALMVDDWNGDTAPLDRFRGAVLSALLAT